MYFLLDINLNQVKIVGDQPDRSGEYLLEYPCGLCCYEDYLYVCDNRIPRIQIFTLDLNYVDTIMLESYSPCRIQISESTIGVYCFDAILFYDLKTRALKHEYNFSSYEMNYIDSIFCFWNEKSSADLFI